MNRHRSALFSTVLTSLAVLLTAWSSHAATVQLAWDPNSEADLAGYRIYVGPASGAYTTNYVLGKVTTITITNLNYGTPYYFAATAHNTAGLESAPSNEVMWHEAAPVAPAVPPLPGLVSRGMGKAAASFPYTDSAVSSFKVYTNNVLAIAAAPKASGSTASTTILELPFMQPGIVYSVQVSAVGTNGLESARSAARTGRIPAGITIRRN